MQPVLKINDLSFQHGSLEVIRSIRLSLNQGETVAIMGRSGCGKSTLLKLIHGLLTEENNSIEVCGRISMLFQQDNLLPWYSLSRNIHLALASSDFSHSKKKKMVENILSELNLAEFSHFLPSRLSGGMKQKGALARALITQPDLLLMDEPFAAVDMLTRRQLTESFLATSTNSNMAKLMVTHDPDEALFLADRIIIFSPRPATIIAEFENSARVESWDEFYKSVHTAQLREKLSSYLSRDSCDE